MNCTEFNTYIDDALDAQMGNLQDGQSAEQQSQFDAHRATCADCQAVYATEMRRLEAMRSMSVPAPSADFADRIIKKAISENLPHQQHHRQGFMLGFGSAAAAALAVWVVVGMFPNELPDTVPAQTVASVDTTVTQGSAKQQPAPVLSIALNERQSIKLAFFSGKPLQGARITIRLPENVALVGYPGRRELSWKTNLKEGDNLLSLPVIATQVAQGELVADIEYQGQVKTLKLNLETGAAGTSSVDTQIHQLVG